MRYELLPQMQEELLLREGHFLLTTQQFQGQLAWEGYRYLQQLRVGSGWHWVYQVGELHVEKFLYLHPQQPIWVLRYAFSGPVLFRWIPLWAVRPWHTLRSEPIEVLRKGEKLLCPEGITLHFSVSPVPRFVPWPHAYYGAFYSVEAERGYAATEVLSATECWEWRLHRAGEITILLSPEPLNRTPMPVAPPAQQSGLRDALRERAEEFFLETPQGEYILAGHPWFGVWGRDTFISLPGLTWARGQEARFHRITETALQHLSSEGRFPNTFPDGYTAEDTGLWWIWSLLQVYRMGASGEELWRRYGEALQQVLISYLHRLAGEDGLLRVEAFPPASWMDAVIEGRPAVERRGALVELNALWYAALRFVAEIASQEGLKWRWGLLARRVLAHFKPTFWAKNQGYLADWATSTECSWQIRPNQLLAAALPYRPISDKIAELVLETVERHLLTPRGVRTLSPADPQYVGEYVGDQRSRDQAYHNGTVWPWLVGAYADAKLSIWGQAAHASLLQLVQRFEEALYAYGWGAIAEIYDGDAPHAPKGAPLQAWSIAELLRTLYQLNSL